MAVEFAMPKLGLTMEAGTILEWLVADGAAVESGQEVLRIETDKVETEVEASGSGLLHQTGRVGETYECGVGIGWFLAEGEEPPAAATPTAAAAATPTAAAAASPGPAAAAAAPVRAAAVAPPDGRILASPNARRVAAARGIDLARVVGTGPGGRIVSEDLDAPLLPTAAAAPPSPVGGVSAPATIAARQLADLLGVDLARVAAGPGDGRIGREDVARYVREALAEAAAAPAEGASSAPSFPLLQDPTEVLPLTGMRGTIAERMHQSLHSMAQLSLTMDADMTAVVADRERRRAADEQLPGYTDYVIAAAAAALVEHPHVNSQVTDDGVALLPAVHVGMAVAVDGGLVVPVVHDTPDRTLEDLSAETTRLADAARSGALALADLEGGTFSVTALGMFGVDAFTPVINPPNTAILGVGRLRHDTAWTDEGPERVTRLTLSLTWDHRAFDGTPAAEFCRTIVRRLEAWE